MANIYLPVEISRREIVAKTMLATRLAADGHQVLVFHSDLFDLVGWPGPGIYIGKNFFRGIIPHSLEYLKRMKRAGVRAWHLDEEGGVFLGATEQDWRQTLERRHDMSALDADDRVLTWGDWQREVFEAKSLAAPVVTVGHTNFDICRPLYHDAFSSFDAAMTGGLSDYILINTRFTLVNGRSKTGRHVIHADHVRSLFSRLTPYDKLVADGKCYFEFIGLIAKLAARYKDRRIVLRPHPGEDETNYMRILEPLENVTVTGTGDVGSWIRRAHAVVHNGCTTAIQAVIAGKPVVTFEPVPDDSGMMAGLPNQIGTLARNVDEVIAAIETPLEHTDSGAWHRTISAPDTIERLAALIAAEADSLPAAAPLATVQRLAAHGAMSGLTRGVARAFLPERRRQYQNMMEYFDPGFFAKIESVAPVARKFYGAEIGLRKLSNRCFAFTPPESGGT